MKIRVILQDGQERDVESFQLDKMLSSGMVKKFFRSGKWVIVSKDTIRGSGRKYSGPERRNPSTIRFL